MVSKSGHFLFTYIFNFKTDLTADIDYKVKNGTFKYSFSSSPNDSYQVKVLTATDLFLVKNHTGNPKMIEEITFKK